jgi:antibiotic biosynthesis monooxygenase (ABM) superfamily enzyme
MHNPSAPTSEGEPEVSATEAAALSVHARAVITWCAIFPLASFGMTVLGPFTVGWVPVLRALVLTAFVVPTATYLVVPRLTAGYVKHRTGKGR